MTADLSALLDRLTTLHAEATPGPWRNDEPSWVVTPEPWGSDGIAEVWNPADAALVVAAVNALPTLTAAVRRVQALADQWDHGEAFAPHTNRNPAQAIRDALNGAEQ